MIDSLQLEPDVAFLCRVMVWEFIAGAALATLAANWRNAPRRPKTIDDYRRDVRFELLFYSDTRYSGAWMADHLNRMVGPNAPVSYST